MTTTHMNSFTFTIPAMEAYIDAAIVAGYYHHRALPGGKELSSEAIQCLAECDASSNLEILKPYLNCNGEVTIEIDPETKEAKLKRNKHE